MTDDFGLLNDKEQAFVDAYTEKIRTQERNRIIRIIENAIIDSEGYCHADTVIATIKGENE